MSSRPPPDLLTRARDAYREWLISPQFFVPLPLNPSPQSPSAPPPQPAAAEPITEIGRLDVDPIEIR